MKLSASEIKSSKGRGKLAFITCYDFPMANAIGNSSVDVVLVGDSLGEVLYNFSSTKEVTVEMMKCHTQAVCSGAKQKHIVADLPYNSYNSPQDAVKNSKILIQSGADSVKLENPASEVLSVLIKENIEVCGHVGLTPQTIQNYKKQGTTKESAEQILIDAKRLSEGGCYAIVLEAIPENLAMKITNEISIPTIGIAAGKHCDGQIIVHYDILGLTGVQKKYFQLYANLSQQISEAVEKYAVDVKKN